MTLFEPGHRDTTLSDWQDFCQLVGSGWWPTIEEVIDRAKVDLPPWFIPLARGVAIGSDLLLYRADYRAGSYRPRGWTKFNSGVFNSGLTGSRRLRVRQVAGQNLWTVERYRPCSRSGDEEVLVHVFGSTPIFTRNYQSAMRLAEYCDSRRLPGLKWVKIRPQNVEAAIDHAKKRRNDEAVAISNAHAATSL
jgi:hypothetical protein